MYRIRITHVRMVSAGKIQGSFRRHRSRMMEQCHARVNAKATKIQRAYRMWTRKVAFRPRKKRRRTGPKKSTGNKGIGRERRLAFLRRLVEQRAHDAVTMNGTATETSIVGPSRAGSAEEPVDVDVEPSEGA